MNSIVLPAVCIGVGMIVTYLVLRGRGNQVLHSASAAPAAAATPERTQFESLLFADQDLSEIVSLSSAPAGEDSQNPWVLFRSAQAEHQSGNDDAAKRHLRGILRLRETESRVQLWAWNALRKLGERADSTIGDKVLGAVFEVPVDGGTEILATYADRSARYINRTGRTIVWDQQTPPIAPLCALVVANAQRAVHSANLVAARNRTRTPLVRITLLTPEGPRVTEASFEQLQGPLPLSAMFVAAGQLLTALVDAALKKSTE